MRVCILQTVLDPYKGANHLPLFAAASGISFTILCNRSKARKEDLPANVHVVAVPGRTGPYYYGCADALFAFHVLRRYPTSDPFWKTFNVVHLNQVMGPAFRCLTKTGIPLLFTIHHPVTADREVALQESGFFAGLSWRLKYALLISWQRSLCRTCDRIMTVSHTVSERLQREYGCPAEHIVIIPNGVDGSMFAPDSREPLFDVVSVGSFIHPRKGFRYLMEAYRALAAKGYRIADVGRRSEKQMSALRSIPSVILHGTVDQKTVRELIQRSSVLISTSLYEGFGLSLIEALACGRPAFAFAAGAVPEVLTPIDPSLVIPVRKASELVSRVDAFLHEHAEERARLGKIYRGRVLELYSTEKAALALEALYRRMQRS